jgi:hypothetical protein
MQSLPQSSLNPTHMIDRAMTGDHDQPYRFGHRPTASAPFPFSTRQYARLLVLRSRVQAGLFAADDLQA